MKELATFAAGCFWGVQDLFDELKGVTNTTVGYTGGHTKDPTYKEVCSDKTGHAEAIQIEYDPEKISYNQLLTKFWKIHDPTQTNRQGPDIGSQYRSEIFYHNEDQRKAAIKSKNLLEERIGKGKVATEITANSEFYKAEEYHQKYYKKNGGSCSIF